MLRSCEFDPPAPGDGSRKAKKVDHREEVIAAVKESLRPLPYLERFQAALARREGKTSAVAAVVEKLEGVGRKVLVVQDDLVGAPPVAVNLDDFAKVAAKDELERRLKEIRETGRKVGVRETLLLAELSAKAGEPLDARVEFTAEAARFKRLCSPARRGKVAR